MTVSDEYFEHIVEFYHKAEYRAITDYEKVVANKTTTSLDGETIYVFEAPGQTIYLNGDGYAVTIGKQMVDREHNQYLYKWGDYNSSTFDYVGPYEWLRTDQTSPEPVPAPDEDEEEE